MITRYVTKIKICPLFYVCMCNAKCFDLKILMSVVFYILIEQCVF